MGIATKGTEGRNYIQKDISVMCRDHIVNAQCSVYKVSIHRDLTGTS